MYTLAAGSMGSHTCFLHVHAHTCTYTCMYNHVHMYMYMHILVMCKNNCKFYSFNHEYKSLPTLFEVSNTSQRLVLFNIHIEKFHFYL